ncbi:hypothetical protein IU397_11680 [Actibacterium sp. 188UL27-1]|nr:hypothetical protein [Actibacterium sp. 188UL27-1]
MGRILGLTVATLAGAVLYYISRFWGWSLWPRDGLLGIEALRPQGGLVTRWLRGSDFTEYDLLIWAVGAFLVLTLLQKLFDLFKRDDG